MSQLKNATPHLPVDRHWFFVLKKCIVDMFLAKARIDDDREIHVRVRMDL